MTTEQIRTLEEQMFENFGPIVGGKDLYTALGFKTYASFHRVKRLDELGVHVFSLPGRKGWFAMTAEIAAWIRDQADKERSKLA